MTWQLGPTETAGRISDGRKPYNCVGPDDVGFMQHPSDLKPTLYSHFYITLEVRKAGVRIDLEVNFGARRSSEF
ncbi:unnamed protein product [Citrullus colocynthis]|uniref:Uncharacterized protein n=1 Tax=Citrullus colocynthis TaxID=252529 RepID=A0ABP0Z379_9ROSI